MGQLEEAVGYLIHELDLDALAQVRAQLPLLNHVRTDMYALEELKNDNYN